MDPIVIARQLIGCPSVTTHSNAQVSGMVQGWLEGMGFEVEMTPYPDLHGVDKVVLAARRLPQSKSSESGERSAHENEDVAGIGFFAHTDVVSVDGWCFPGGGPFDAAIDQDRLWGRGACDMKGPIAAALAAIAAIPVDQQRQPLYFFVTGDEESGMAGARLLAQDSRFFHEMVERRAVGVIGEPTELQVVNAHKGGCHLDVLSHGVAAHSSTVEGCNANWNLIPFLQYLHQIAERCEADESLQNSQFSPATLSLNIVVDNQPAAANITVGTATCKVFFRPMPETAWEPLLQEIYAEAERMELTVRRFEPLRPLHTPGNRPFVQRVLQLLDQHAPQTVCYATDGCCFGSLADMIVLGPGSIEQAHRPDEWVAIDQLRRGALVYEKLFRAFTGCIEHASHSINEEPRQLVNDPLQTTSAAPRELPEGYSIRAAQESDLHAVFELLRPFVEQRKVLRRTRAETSALLATGFVAEFAGEVVGFSAVEIYSKKLSEIQCLTVQSTHQGRGIGGSLVKHCVELARGRGVMEVMAISSSDRFLENLGFGYSLPDQKRALFCQLRSREEVYREIEELGE